MLRVSVPAVVLLFFLGLGALAQPPEAAVETALADYVHKPDASFAWKVRREGKLGLGRYVEMIMTSQTWKDVVWKHQVFVFRPASCERNAKHAFMFITGGGWRPELENPPGDDEKLPRDAETFAIIAEKARSPLVIVMHVPQQPIFGGLKEDGAISHTFSRYIKSGDPTWPLLLPMTKSAVRAMDASTALCKEKWGLEIENFTVTGGSKRGWTTYLTGAVEPRATALAPIVINMLNMPEHLKLQRESFGDLSDEIREYQELGIDRAVETEPGRKLVKIVDPFSYREKLTQPKLLILGTNDRYWPVDSTKLYFEELKGQKHLLFVPNNGHGVKDILRIAGGLIALHRQAQGGEPLPSVEYALTALPRPVGKRAAGSPPFAEPFQLSAKYGKAPKEATLWQATAKTRDFRDSVWTSSPVPLDGMEAKTVIDRDHELHKAAFLEGTWEIDEDTPLMLSTQLFVIEPEEK